LSFFPPSLVRRIVNGIFSAGRGEGDYPMLFAILFFIGPPLPPFSAMGGVPSGQEKGPFKTLPFFFRGCAFSFGRSPSCIFFSFVLLRVGRDTVPLFSDAFVGILSPRRLFLWLPALFFPFSFFLFCGGKGTGAKPVLFLRVAILNSG